MSNALILSSYIANKVVLAVFAFLLLLSPEIGLSSSEYDRERKLLKSIKCLVCEGQSVLGSEAEFAKSMREKVREHIAEGKSDEQIYAEIAAVYGDEVFFEPPFAWQTYILWFFPLIFLVFGIIFVISAQKKCRIEDCNETN